MLHLQNYIPYRILILFTFLFFVQGCSGPSNYFYLFQPEATKFQLADGFQISENQLWFQNQNVFSLNDKILVDLFKFGNKHYVLSYNSSKNVASGQKLKTLYVGLELHVLDGNNIRFVGNFFTKSSFESIFKKISIGNSLLICSDVECYIFDDEQHKHYMNVDKFVSGYEITQINNDNGIEVDLIKSFDSYELHKTDKNIYDLKKLRLNTKLEFVGISDIDQPDRPIQISKINNNNFLYLAQDNSEGRVVWGQKYLLDGLFLDAKNTKKTIDLNYDYYLQHRNLKFLFSERYSFSRKSQLFLLHVARYYNMLTAYKALNRNAAESSNFQRHMSDLEQLLLFESSKYKTVEQLVSFNFSEIGNRRYLIFGPESDFWANGINVPINYVSDYIIALLNVNTDKSLRLAKSLVETNYLLMDRLSYPSWRYWSGLGLSGWENTSIKAPSFSGEQHYPFAADIIYRTTDAKAILLSCAHNKLREILSFDCVKAEEKIFKYLTDGDLEPYLLALFPDRHLSTFAIAKLNQKFSRFTRISDIRNLYFLNEILQ